MDKPSFRETIEDKRMAGEKTMTYSEYRSRFKSVSEFEKAFGQLSEQEARALIEASNSGTTAKACMFATWEKCRKLIENTGKKETDGSGRG